MNMTESYLQIMIESLEKKKDILDCVYTLNQKQAEILLQSDVDKDLFDKTMNEKGQLIDKMNQLDDGFEHTYQLVKPQIAEHKEEYIEQLKTLKELVTHVVEQGVGIKAQEERLKKQLDMMFQKEHKKLREKRISTKVAQGYYQNMNMLNFVDPQLLDKKK